MRGEKRDHIKKLALSISPDDGSLHVVGAASDLASAKYGMLDKFGELAAEKAEFLRIADPASGWHNAALSFEEEMNRHRATMESICGTDKRWADFIGAKSGSEWLMEDVKRYQATADTGQVGEFAKLASAEAIFEQAKRHEAMMECKTGAFAAFADLHGDLAHGKLHDIERHRHALASVLGPIDDMNAAFETRLSLQAALGSASLDMVHAAKLGPLADLRSSGALDGLSSFAAAQNASKMLEIYESRYRLPDAVEVALLMKERFLENAFAPAFTQDVAKAMAQAHAPWLDVENSIRSAKGFAELHGLGYAIRDLEPFGERLLQGVRANLGDWRDPITFPTTVFGDLGRRSAFYAERGLRGDLTDFPPAAFEESLAAAELTQPRLFDIHGDPIEADNQDDASAFARTNRAHRWLTRFEAQFRRFIDRQMTDAFGADWPKHRLAGDMCDVWVEKKRKSEAAGMPPQRLIAYADFTDYERVICKRDNWQIFARFFRDPAHLREALQRLHLPRIEAMHARPLSNDDLLHLFSELRRLGNLFKR